jgi:hypothetical protein
VLARHACCRSFFANTNWAELLLQISPIESAVVTADDVGQVDESADGEG